MSTRCPQYSKFVFQNSFSNGWNPELFSIATRVKDCVSRVYSTTIYTLKIVKVSFTMQNVILFPAGTRPQNNVVWTLLRRQKVKTTSIQRRSDVLCRLGCLFNKYYYIYIVCRIDVFQNVLVCLVYLVATQCYFFL